jgi:hypothetical protein
MKKLITLFAIAGMVLALAPAVHAQVLMSTTVNDGSFERDNVGNPLWAPVTMGVWSLTAPAYGGQGILTHGSHVTHGDESLFANGGFSVTATSSDLLGTGGYTAVGAGDEFTYSYDYKPAANTSQVIKFQIDFGNGAVDIDSATVSSSGSYLNMSGTYTATATDATGTQLAVVLTVGGHTFTDSAVLSVVENTGTLIMFE